MSGSPLDRLSETLPISRWLEYGLLLAVSGGADSVALLHFLARFSDRCGGPKPVVGHVNHRLRGDESDGDAVFVRNLSGEYGLRSVEYRIEPEAWSRDSSGSREAAARTLRYDFLKRAAEELGLRYVATAHNADDQTETVLHRLIRGTGPVGAAGMSRFRPLGRAVTLVRPFLDVTRREIVDFLNGIGASFRNDASNFENDFTRNRIRNELLPMLREQFNPRIDAAVRRWARLAGETEEIVGDLADSLLERVVRHRSPSEIVLAASELRRLKSATLRALLVRLWKQNGWPLRDMGFEQWKSIADCFFHGTAPLPLPGSVVAERRGHLFILRRDAADSEV